MARATDVRIRLYCLTCAGGTAAAFAPWRQRSSRLDVHPVEYPGRGARFNEDAATSLDALAEAVASAMEPARGEHYALLGHSLGAIVAFQLARRLVAAGAPLPVVLCAVAAQAPHVPRRDLIYELPDAQFIEKVLALGGVPEEVLEEGELLALMLPVLRRDFGLLERFACAADPVPIPISVFGGLADAAVPAADLMAWSDQTTKSFRCRFYPGGHFFLQDQRLPLIADVESDVAALAAPERAASMS